jgi:hypothetical protein
MCGASANGPLLCWLPLALQADGTSVLAGRIDLPAENYNWVNIEVRCASPLTEVQLLAAHSDLAAGHTFGELAP